MYTYIYIYICIHIHIYIYVYTYIYIYMYECASLSLYIYIHVDMCIYIYMYVWQPHPPSMANPNISQRCLPNPKHIPITKCGQLCKAKANFELHVLPHRDSMNNPGNLWCESNTVYGLGLARSNLRSADASQPMSSLRFSSTH